jgi:hypothetical protein
MHSTDITFQRLKTIVLVGALLALAAAGPAGAFSGALSSVAGEISGSGNWIVTGPTILEWTVTENPDGTWHYDYTFSHPRGDTSHFLLEVSSSFTLDDIFNAGGDFEEIELGTWTPGGSNPNMPGPLFGLKFDDAEETDTEIYFDSTRRPVWGDFYAKDGNSGGYGQNAAWNSGFLDVDPSGPAADGSLANHLLVPDSFGTIPPTPVPESSSLLLLGAALMGTALVTRKRGRS